MTGGRDSAGAHIGIDKRRKKPSSAQLLPTPQGSRYMEEMKREDSNEELEEQHDRIKTVAQSKQINKNSEMKSRLTAPHDALDSTLFYLQSTLLSTRASNEDQAKPAVDNESGHSASVRNARTRVSLTVFQAATCIVLVLFVVWYIDAERRAMIVRNEQLETRLLLLSEKLVESGQIFSAATSYPESETKDTEDVSARESFSSSSMQEKTTEGGIMSAIANVYPVTLAVHSVVFVSVVGSLLYMAKREFDLAWERRCSDKESGLEFSVSEFLFYRMDYFLSSTATAKPVALMVATYVLIVSGAMAYCISSENVDIGEALWISWTFVADPGTHAEEQGLLLRAIALGVTIGGMLIFALMIGIIADGVSDLLDDLKQGKSRVIESGHTLILGWSDKVLPTIGELAIANESEEGGVIVVLADRPKEEMESELKAALTEEQLRGTVVVCRSGSPLLMMDLLKVSAPTAKAVIVLSDPNADADESDARAVRIVMSLTGINIQCHMVVEMCDIDNRELVLLVGKGMVETVVAHDIIGRLMIQCARQPGLAQILEQILGFDGDEFYIKQWPELVGKTFKEVAFRFDKAIPIGVKPSDPTLAQQQLERCNNLVHCQSDVRTSRRAQKQGQLQAEQESDMDMNSVFDSRSRNESISSVFGPGPRITILNPPNDYVIQPGDGIIVLAEDDDTYKPSEEPWPCPEAKRAFDRVKSQGALHVLQRPEKLLFCGWRRDMDDMIHELDKLVGPGSQLTLMCLVPTQNRLLRFNESRKINVKRLTNLKLEHEVGNPVLRRHLEKLDLHHFDSILILADEAVETNMQTADSRSLASLLLIRDIINKSTQQCEEIIGVPEQASISALENELHQLDPSMNPPNTERSSSPRTRTKRSLSTTAEKPKSNLVKPRRRTKSDVHTTLKSRGRCPKNQLHRKSQPRHTLYSSTSESSMSDDDGGKSTTSTSSEEWRSYFDSLRRKRAMKPDPASSDRPMPSSIETCVNPCTFEAKEHKRNCQGEGTDDEEEEEKSRNSSKRMRSFRESSAWVPDFHPEDRGKSTPVIISEILDSRTKSLITVAQVSDYVMSNEIVACAMAMVAEDRAINNILTELLSAEGCEIHVRSCLDYCRDGETIDFWEITGRARRRGEIALGYKPKEELKAVLNPREKSQRRTWNEGDTVVVLSDN